jgi:hypothetical protein
VVISGEEALGFGGLSPPMGAYPTYKSERINRISRIKKRDIF